MKTLYRVTQRTQQGKPGWALGQTTTQTRIQPDQLFDRATVARKVRALNERFSARGVEYVAEAVDIATLPAWQLADLFKAGKVSYDELLTFAGVTVAEQAIAIGTSAS